MTKINDVGPDANGWMPIETAPKHAGTEIFAARFGLHADGVTTMCIREPFVSFWSPSLGKFYCDPTHWLCVVPPMPDVAVERSVKRKATSHASTSPGPVNCQIRKRFQKEAYPRTCERCGLGPCPFFHTDGRSKSQGQEP